MVVDQAGRSDVYVQPSLPRIDSLHGLRFLAAFSVLFMHACDWIAHFASNDVFVRVGASIGVLGMPLFFVLSGFVIQYSYAGVFSRAKFSYATLDFFAARFARLYPLYIVFLIVGILLDTTLSWLAGPREEFYLYLGHALTLTQSWFYLLTFGRHILANGFGLSWSISTELFFYVCFPFLVTVIAFLRTRRAAAIALALFIALTYFLFVEAYLWLEYILYWAKDALPQRPAPGEHGFIRYLFYISPWSRIFEFILGCLTGRLFGLLQDRPPGDRETRIAAWVLGLAIVTLVFLSWVNDTMAGSSQPFFAGLYFLVQRTFGSAVPLAVVIFCVARYRSGFATWLSSGLIVGFGEISYSLYAVHSFILRPLFATDAGPLTFDGINIAQVTLKIIMGVVLTFLMSYATYRLIEVPSRRWLRAKTSRVLARIYGPAAASAAPRAPSARRLAAATIFFAAVLAACAYYQFGVLAMIAPTLSQ